MDSVTQIILGAAVGEVTLGRKAGNKAPMWGAVAGTIPDLDTLPGQFLGMVDRLDIHRGVSHSVIFSLIMAPILGWLIVKYPKVLLSVFLAAALFVPIYGSENIVIQLVLSGIAITLIGLTFIKYKSESEISVKSWSLLMFWGLFTHPLLDCFTTWGTQLFWPLDLRVSFHSIFVIDPIYTLPFLVLMVSVLFLKRSNIQRRKLAWWGLGISTTYLLFTLINKFFINRQFETALSNQGVSWKQYQTRPMPLNNILWALSAEGETHYFLGYYSWFDEALDIPLYAIPKNHHLLDPYRRNRDLQRLLHLSQGYYAVQEHKEGFQINDLRFGQGKNWTTGNGEFVFSYIARVENGKIVDFYQLPRQMDPPGQMLGDLWERILGRNP